MAKEIKKKEVETKTSSGPIRFHELHERDEEAAKARQAIIMRIAKGEVVLQGPDHHIVEVIK